MANRTPLVLIGGVPQGLPAGDTLAGITGYTLGSGNKALVIFDGDSLTAGRGSSHEITSADDFAAGPYPTATKNTLLAQMPGVSFTFKNFGVSGQKMTDMIADAATQIDVLFDPATYQRGLIIVGGKTNDIADGGATAQQVIDSTVAYHKARRSAKWLTAVLPILPRTSFFGSGISASEFASRAATANAWFRLHYLEFADIYIDLLSLTGLVYGDGTHLTDAGYLSVGNYIGVQSVPLLNLGFNPQSIPYLLSGTTGSGSGSGSTTTILNLRGQGANNSTVFTDEAGHTVTGNGAAKISTTQFKFGTSSIYLDGSPGTYLSTASNTDFNLGVGDFTMEAWIYKTGAGSGYPGLFARGDNAQNQWALAFPNAGARLEFYVSGSGGYAPQGLSHSVDVPLNTWTHIALVSSGGIRKLYQNGTLVGTATTNSNLETNATGKPLLVGYLPAVGGSGGDVFPGYMHVRFTKTVQYTGSFTPPTSF